MKILNKIILAVSLIGFIPATMYAAKPAPTKYKCMIQMTNYVGEGAYIVVSLINPKGAYEKTLRVMGSDKKWYKDVKEWYKAYAKKTTNISAITGASVSGGDRSVTVLELDDAKLDAGYKIRFETAVEDKEYYVKDVEIPFTKAAVSGKTEGTNYIRYVRFSAN
ncbi:MAG: DUF2271 domain-containing protein [Pedobacter sp.]